MDADGHNRSAAEMARQAASKYAGKFSLRNHTCLSTPVADEANNLRKSSLLSVHPVRQAKPGFSIVLKREQHVK
jgi:hypothetical protein